MTATLVPADRGLDARVDKRSTPLLGSPHRFRLAVFAGNTAGGSNLTTSPDTLRGTWEETVRLARAADDAGVEALVPVARWRSMNPDAPRTAHRSFETFTWAAGLAALTRRIQLFATFHVPVTHPVRAAKEVATVDHISGGRFGMNVVSGWNEDELAMFGVEQRGHDDRYAVAEEWMTFLRRAWHETEAFDVDGEHFFARGVVSEPKPLQDPDPVVMGAGSSPAGRDWAARHADVSLALVPSVGAVGPTVARVQQQAADRYGRELLVMGAGHLICRPTEAEARAELRRQVEEVGDLAAARRAVRMLVPDPRAAVDRDAMAASAVTGFFALPFVGTPEQVVEQMAAASAAGLDGMTLSWLDYEEGVAQLRDELFPLMRSAGLREPEDDAAAG